MAVGDNSNSVAAAPQTQTLDAVTNKKSAKFAEFVKEEVRAGAVADNIIINANNANNFVEFDPKIHTQGNMPTGIYDEYGHLTIPPAASSKLQLTAGIKDLVHPTLRDEFLESNEKMSSVYRFGVKVCIS